MRILLPVILLIMLAFDVYSQTVKIKYLELQSNGDIFIFYDLTDDAAGRKFSLHLYTSIDNYIQPMTKVSGDVGVNLSPGANKKVIWHAKEELGGPYKGELAFELKGNIYIPFIALDGFNDYKVLKRGKPYDITWTGGRGDNVLNFELYKGETKVKVFEERPNVGNTKITIPTDVKPGRYKFKISDSRNKDEVVFTDEFQVRRKIPLVLKVGLTAVVVGAVAVLAKGEDDESKIGQPPLPTK
jgi:hypothetical protein